MLRSGIGPLPALLPVAASLLAVLALSCGLLAFLPKRSAALPVAGLAVLALPLLSSLQFYAGYPLRLITAEASRWLLAPAGRSPRQRTRRWDWCCSPCAAVPGLVRRRRAARPPQSGGGAGSARMAARMERRAAAPAGAGRGRAAFCAALPRRHRAHDRWQAGAGARQVQRPTRMLHPAADCYRELGWRIEQARLERDADARLWRCFVTRRAGAPGMRVCERIVDAAGNAFTDTSAWYWAAASGQSPGPWQALTVARPL